MSKKNCNTRFTYVIICIYNYELLVFGYNILRTMVFLILNFDINIMLYDIIDKFGDAHENRRIILKYIII